MEPRIENQPNLTEIYSLNLLIDINRREAMLVGAEKRLATAKIFISAIKVIKASEREGRKLGDVITVLGNSHPEMRGEIAGAFVGALKLIKAAKLKI